MFTGPGSYTLSCLCCPALCLDIPSQIAHKDEGRVQVFPRNGAAYQLWVFTESAGRAGCYTIHSSLGPSKRLGIHGNSTADYARVLFQRPNDTAFQAWRLEQDPGGGDYRLINDATGLFLDLRDEAKGHGGIVQQRPRIDVANQRWLITPRT